ncbi:MAG TPA: chemotaxis response regulator protein-glutamate methylesterase [Vicinamibacterales bacterium]|nr:chemotaxis response regulator protein-glutamate methylesterase [Vicinamibacterales bacterium]
MKKAKVLVVDDAMLIRRMVADILTADPAIDVVGEAPNGRIALQKIAQLAPDLVTLDVEMPEMNGLQTLKEIRKTHPRLPVIMFSAVTERGAADTLEALHYGASDYVTKPTSAAGRESALSRIREDLLPKIKSLCRLAGPPSPGVKTAAGSRANNAFTLRALGQAITADVVAISLSTGGPQAIGQIVAKLPADFRAPVMVVPHMAQIFTKFFAERLAAQTALAVVEATDGQVVEPATVYVAPADFHLTVSRSNGVAVLALDQTPPLHAHRPAADVLFQSVADAYGSRALALVLTGMGQDGVKGCEEITTAGGRVLVQDEATSVVWETAGLVARAGLADAVLPLGAIAGELTRRTTRSSATNDRGAA